jgi:NADPH oxidase
MLYIGAWVIFQLSLFTLGFFLQKTNENLSLLNQLTWSVYISRGAGLCLAVTPALMLFTMCRRTITYLRRYISFFNVIFPDFSVYFHKICAYTVLFWSMVHMTGHYFNFYGVEKIIKINTMYNLHYTIYASFSGHLMMISMFFIFAFSGYYFRKYYFEIFWYSHHFFILFFIVYPLHGIGCFVKTNNGQCLPYFSGFIIAPVLLIYILERIIRELSPVVKINETQFCSGDTFKIRFTPKNKLVYKPGQYLLLKCDLVSKQQWHPFTISNSPLDPHIELTIRCLGDWTTKFRDLLIKNKDNLPYIQYDGIFGSPVDTITSYDSAILIASGIGITPYISMLKYILQKGIDNLNIKKIDLIWINRDPEYFEWFTEELQFFEKHSNTLSINFHMYLTEQVSDPERVKNLINNKWGHLNNVYKTNLPLTYGRPDFNKIFKEYTVINNQLVVGCFVCSSKSVEKTVKETAKQFSNKNITFKFKSESFV